MRKRAIGQIIACSIIAVLLSTVLLAALGCNAAGIIDGNLPGVSVKNITNAVQETVESLPVPDITFFGLPLVWADDTDDYRVGNGSYTETPTALDIDWTHGRVVVIASEGDEGVTVTEYPGNVDPNTASTDGIGESFRMRHTMKNGTLRIREYKSGINTILNGETLTKTLLVTLPKTVLDNLEIDTSSVDIVLTGISASVFDMDAASGSITAKDCAFTRADLDVAAISGTFTDCAIDRIDMDFASGSVTFDLNKAPQKLDVDCTSGDLWLLLPASASFRVDADTVSGKVAVEGFENMTVENGKTVVNGGESTFDFDLISGSVTIEPKNANTF